jgi:hypothetical protein
VSSGEKVGVRTSFGPRTPDYDPSTSADLQAVKMQTDYFKKESKEAHFAEFERELVSPTLKFRNKSKHEKSYFGRIIDVFAGNDLLNYADS